MNRTRVLGSALARCVVVAAIAGAAGCASEDVTVSVPSDAPSAAATSGVPSAVSSAAGAPSTTGSAATATSTTAAGGANCLATELSVSLGTPGGAAGSTELPLQFSNIGSRTCTLDGYPGVSYVTGPGGAEVGQAAVRSGAQMSPVQLSPGSVATAAVKATVVGNYPADQCQPTAVGGLNVYSPNTTEAIFLSYPTTGCATNDTSITQLTVQPVTAG